MSEKTEKWVADEPGFMGTIRQLLDCAKCGEHVSGGRDHKTPRRMRHVFKPSMHILCDECYDSLPE